MDKKIQVAVIGATGYVGQRFVSLLQDHPYFALVRLGASERSAGKTYGSLMKTRWVIDTKFPENLETMEVSSILDIEAFCEGIDLVFCAVDMPKDEIRKLEEAIARTETVCISNNSAHRKTNDVPMMIPEVNGHHAAIIGAQRKRLGTKHGFIACKPNCSIQSYVPALDALKVFEPEAVFVSTYQAISGAGKTFETWPEMKENLIPFISGEEEKSEQEPLKIWGELSDDSISLATSPVISAQCYRVAVQEGHTASVAVKFKKKPTRQQILDAWSNFEAEPEQLKLPMAPSKFLQYFEDDTRPQPKLDANTDKGMAVFLSRLREDSIFDWKFTCLSHNTLRGAAGGALLMAEFLYTNNYILNYKSR